MNKLLTSILVLSLLAYPSTAYTNHVCVDTLDWDFTEDARALAQVYVNEASFPGVGDPISGDMLGIYAVLQYKMHYVYPGQDLAATARIVSPTVFSLDPVGARSNRHPRRRRSRLWITTLRSHQRPRYWPQALDWEDDYRYRWFLVLEQAQRVVDGLVPIDCEHLPFTWGNNTDVRINYSAKLESGKVGFAGCPNAHNRYLYKVDASITLLFADQGQPYDDHN